MTRVLVIAAIVSGVWLGQPARANTSWQFDVGYEAGSVGYDQDLNNYRWDTTPTWRWGAHALVRHGWLATGLRLRRSATTQASGIPGETRSPDVNITSAQWVSQFRGFAWLGFEFWGSGHVGRVHMGYNPDRMEFDVGAGEPVVVNFDPVDEWEFGYGINVRRQVTGDIGLALGAERTSFALDTAHRAGDEIIEQRERFDSWDVSLSLSWLFDIK